MVANIVPLYQSLSANLAQLATTLSRAGDNQTPERDEVLAAFDQDQQAGTANIRAIRAQIQSDSPQTEVIQAAGFTFNVLERNARWLAGVLATGLFAEIGKDLAPGAFEMVESLAHMLGRLGTALLSLLLH